MDLGLILLEEMHAMYSKSGQEHIVVELIGLSGQPSTIILNVST